MALWIATAKDIGFAAYHRGDPRCMNPYCPGPAEAADWFMAWDKAADPGGSASWRAAWQRFDQRPRTAYISGHDGRNPSARESELGRRAP